MENMDGGYSPEGAIVYLNVYDLTEHNDWTYWCGVGVFHSGVEVYGVEYAFGGHEYDIPGVFATNPQEAPGTVTFRESVPVGRTTLSPTEVYEVVQHMGNRYRGNRYHLLQMNCNTFSDELCLRLTGQHAPLWINRLAGIAVALHCLLPQGWLPPLRPPTVIPTQAALTEANAGAGSNREDEAQQLLDPLQAPPSDLPLRPARSAPQLVT